MSWTIRARWVLALALVMATAGYGCAYFNLFYNAEKAFSDAERAGADVDPRDQPTSAQRQGYQKAIRKCEMLLDEYPDSDLVDDALFLMGKCHLRLDEYSDAIRNFDNVLANFPQSDHVEETMYLKSLAHLGRGEEQVALDWLARLREAYPDGRFGAEALFRLGDSYAEDGKYEQAVRYYEDFLERYPKSEDRARVQLSLARTLVELQRPGEAAATLETFDLDSVPREQAFEAQRLRVLSLLENHQAEEALDLTDELQSLAAGIDDRAEARLLKGRALLESGHEDEGVDELENLANDMVNHPASSQARWAMVEHFSRTEGPTGTRLRAVFQNAESAQLRGEYGVLLRERRDELARYDKLVASFEASDSTAANSAFELAEMVLFSFERPQDALYWYHQVVDLAPDEPIAARAMYGIGYVQSHDLDETDEAETTYAELEERWPDSPQARALRGEDFTAPKPRSREELEAMLAAGPVTAGAFGAAGGGANGDPRLSPTRGLRYGGPGALTPRERSVR